jgi:hypothetical protein
MEYSQSIQLTQLSGLSKLNTKNVYKSLQNNTYNNDLGLGYKNVEIIASYINATLVRNMPTFILQPEPETNNVIEQEIILVNEIDFGLDFKFDLLDIYGSGKNISKVLSAIFPIMGRNVTTNTVVLSPVRIIKKFSERYETTVERLVVNNFQLVDGVVGKYDVRIQDNKAASSIIKKFSADISKANLIIKTREYGSVRLGVSTNGSISIKAEEDAFLEVLVLVKTFLFERLGK